MRDVAPQVLCAAFDFIRDFNCTLYSTRVVVLHLCGKVRFQDRLFNTYSRLVSRRENTFNFISVSICEEDKSAYGKKCMKQR